MADYELELDDAVLGDLEEEEFEAVLGALPRQYHGRLSAIRKRFKQAKRRAAGIRSLTQANITPGVSRTRRGKLVLGMGNGAFGAAGTTVVLTQQPQRPIKVERVVIIAEKDGAVAAGIELVDDLKVGTQSQLASNGAVPASAFAPDAFDVELDGDVAVPGTNVTLELSRTAAPGVGTDVLVAACIIGSAVV